MITDARTDVDCVVGAKYTDPAVMGVSAFNGLQKCRLGIGMRIKKSVSQRTGMKKRRVK